MLRRYAKDVHYTQMRLRSLLALTLPSHSHVNTPPTPAYGHNTSTAFALRRQAAGFPSCDAGSDNTLQPKFATPDTDLRRDSMTDTFRHSATHPVQDYRHAAPNGVVPHPEYSHRSAQPTESTGDDEAINCFCGNNEDDGNTVQCDGCNTWQHISCYYPHFGNSSLDDLSHWCEDCRPQTQSDRHAAFIAQKEANEEKYGPQHNGAKRPASNKATVKISHKKKVKDTAAPAMTNGWPPERHTASPRDQPPPTKRPKTSHRPSNSVAQASINGQSRKRNGSSVHHRRSVSRSPEIIIPMYSEEFLRAYREDHYSVPDSNVAGVAIYEAFTIWVGDQEEVAKITDGAQLGDIFMRWDGAPELLSAQTEVEIQERVDPNFVTADNQYAAWKCLVAVQPLAPQACIGELRGHIQYADEYKQDPVNRWSSLVHPEPFVFFHPQLPVCIDARSEGTDVRYIRRSCHPNAELKIIITNQADYHFCFMALRDIEAGDEITIEWGAAPRPQAMVFQAQDGTSTSFAPGVSLWASTVLANCGPCACGHPRDVCLMARMDRRGEVISIEDTAKVPKAGAKRKKIGQHISPLNTHSVNSRSGSEIRKADHEDEPSDSRSASDSVDRDSASRDITPHTHYSMNGMYEMSERERRKVAKEEELFNKQAEEGLIKQKKKRSSAGSTLNTPSATSSKQLHLPTAPASRHPEARPAALPTAKSSNNRRPKPPPTMKSAAFKQSAKPAPPPPRPVYVNADVQCDMDAEDTAARTPPPRSSRPYTSNRQRLLERCAKNNAMHREALSKARAHKAPTTDSSPTTRDIVIRPSSSSSSQGFGSIEGPHSSIRAPDEDIEMRDEIGGVERKSEHTKTPKAESDSMADTAISGKPTAHAAPTPPAPPWPEESDGGPQMHPQKSNPSKPHDMHLIMPPPQSNPFAAAGSLETPLSTASATTPNLLNTSLAASPASLGPLSGAPIFSPSVVASVNPSPARKKLSLSDYTRRTKAKDKEPELTKTDRDSSPMSATSTTVPALLASASELGRVQESGSAVVEEDVKMEDSAPAGVA
ncbi:SET domain-containing protein 3 [Oleoguttula sp. CCFEE 5521]